MRDALRDNVRLALVHRFDRFEELNARAEGVDRGPGHRGLELDVHVHKRRELVPDLCREEDARVKETTLLADVLLRNAAARRDLENRLEAAHPRAHLELEPRDGGGELRGQRLHHRGTVLRHGLRIQLRDRHSDVLAEELWGEPRRLAV